MSAFALALAAAALAQPEYRTDTYVVSVFLPTAAQTAPGTDRVFFTGRDGRVSSRTPEPFAQTFQALQLFGLPFGGDCGLLGIAFHPQYQTNGFVYLSFTSQTGFTVARFTAIGPRATAVQFDPASRFDLLVESPACTPRNGGWIAFAADGTLLIATGDRGVQADAASLTSLRGKLLRIDVDGADAFPADPNRNYAIPANNPYTNTPGARPEIWARGLRNPGTGWIDPATGDLWLPDSGATFSEELNFQPGAGFLAPPTDPEYAGGRDYGWPCFEGTRCSGGPCSCAAANTPPILEYHHFHESAPSPWGMPRGALIAGGFVYRGCAHPELNGAYLFGDRQSSWWIAAHQAGGVIQSVRTIQPWEIAGPIFQLVAMRPRADGEILTLASNIHLVLPWTLIDCNSNGVEDACDIASGAARDDNNDGVPDSCQCPADWDSSGGIDGDDIPAFFTDWQAGEADIDGSGGTDGDDITYFFERWQAGC